MIDVLSLAEQDTQLRKESYREYAGPCPGCAGSNRFRVRWDGECWIWMCRNCWDASEYLPEKGKKRGWGDTIDYLRHYRGKSFTEAKTMTEGQEGRPGPARREPFNRTSERWQSMMHGAMKDHIAHLWSAEDTLALDYARSRGFTDATIRRYQFGYSTRGNIPRLVIPSISYKRYTAVYMRDLRPDVPHNERWKNAPGSSNDEMYLADLLHRRGYPVVLTESALDAISIAQSCLEVVNVVATGGVTNGKEIKALARLSRAPVVLVAFDNDTEGERAAQGWLRILSNSRRLRPLLKDVNDMLIDQWDIKEWILDALNAGEIIGQECCVCGAAIDNPCYEFFYDDQGILYCNRHWPGAKSA